MNKQRTLNNTKLDDSDLDMFQIPNQYQRLLRKDIVHSYYEYYLNGVIGEADQYIELISALRDASPTDEFVIRINSVGGDLATALAIINAIKETQAHVVGFISTQILRYIIFIIEYFGSLPFASVNIINFPLWLTIFVYLLMFIFVFLKNKKHSV